MSIPNSVGLEELQDEEELLRRELLDCAQISADLDLRMEKIKNRIVNKEN